MALLVAGTPLSAQQGGVPLLHAEARLSDYGMTSAGDVQRGRISLVRGEGPPSLAVYWLRSTAVARPARDTGTPPPVVPPVADSVSPGTGLPDAAGMWVWDTRELLQDAAARAAFLDFVARHHVARVFLQLVPAAGGQAAAGFVPFDEERTGDLVASLDSVGARAWALDGDPAYALPENHAGVARTVDRVADYNRGVPPDRRFSGVHYDVEPYLLAGFQGPRRQPILDGYVALVAEVARHAHAAGLEVGVDVPFWLGAPDEETGVPLEATLEGHHGAVLDHVLASVDQVVVMDYRTRPEGPDGIVAHAAGTLDRAAAAGTEVLVGLETGPLADEELFTFAGAGWAGLPPDKGRWVVLSPGAEDGMVRLWLMDGARALQGLRDALRDVDPSMVRHWPAGRPAEVPATKQSFRRLGPQALAQAAARVAASLEGLPAFRGMAYHSYASVRELLEGR